MSTSIAARNQPTAASCPRCRQPMIDPQGLGWCKACGYCRSLEDSKPATPAKQPPAPTRISATTEAITQAPTWIWSALVGILLIVAATCVGGHFLTLKPLERALLTTGQMVFGVGMMLAGQIIGLIKIAPEESTLNFFDAIMPFRLYGHAFKRLPATRHTVYLGAWGLAAIISANVFIGGLDHWTTYLLNKDKNKAGQVQKGKSAK